MELHRSRFGSRRLLRPFLLLLGILAVVAFIYAHLRSANEAYRIAVAKECFTNAHINLDGIQMLPDIMDSDPKPKLGQSVSFHETSCTNGIVKLNARQACAIESAALANPAWDVFVLFASSSGFANHTAKSAIIKALESYPNIRLRNANLWKYARDTPVEHWIQKEHLFGSFYINSHTSDFLRYLSLFKWGGTYLDLDVIVKQNLSMIPSNYAGAESKEFVAAGVLNLDAAGPGHHIAELCLNEFQRSFDGADWSNNGPGVITRVLHRVCNTKHTPLMTRSRCNTFEAFPIESFYAVHWENWRQFFDEKDTELALLKTKDSPVVHVWNKLSVDNRVRVGSNVAYGLLAEKYCPKVYASCGEYF